MIYTSLTKHLPFKRNFLILFLLVTFYLAVTARVFAQSNSSNVNLTISPSLIELTANPGDTIHQTFRVRNNLNRSIYYTISLKKIGANFSVNYPFPQDLPANDEFSSWVKIDPSLFNAKPAEWQDIAFTISIPKSAAYGYYYAFDVEPSQDTGLNGAGDRVLAKIILPILLNVKKADAKMQGSIVSFHTDNFLYEYLPTNFQVDFINTGNVHIKPRGEIFIRNIGQKDLAILEVNEGFATALPGGKRTFTSSWDDGFFTIEPVLLDDGSRKYDTNGHAYTHLVINWNKLTSFRIGRYTADLVMVYSDGKRDVALDASTTFWVFPWKIISGIIVALVGIIFFLRMLLHSYIKSQVKKYKGKNS